MFRLQAPPLACKAIYKHPDCSNHARNPTLQPDNSAMKENAESGPSNNKGVLPHLCDIMSNPANPVLKNDHVIGEDCCSSQPNP